MSGKFIPTQDLVISLVCKGLGESRYNRTAEDYAMVRERISEMPLKQIDYLVNRHLEDESISGNPGWDICHFERGTPVPIFDRYPVRISIETIRKALIANGLRRSRKSR